jgi:hypothetical protein
LHPAITPALSLPGVSEKHEGVSFVIHLQSSRLRAFRTLLFKPTWPAAEEAEASKVEAYLDFIHF